MQDDDFSPDEQPANVEDTVAALVKRSKRRTAVGIRKVFVQQGGRGRLARPGKLAPLQVPLTFWTGGWYRELDLPGLAMLLVAFDQDVEFWLPAEKVPPWYGFSPATANRSYNAVTEGRFDLLTTQRENSRTDVPVDDDDRQASGPLVQ